MKAITKLISLNKVVWLNLYFLFVLVMIWLSLPHSVPAQGPADQIFLPLIFKSGTTITTAEWPQVQRDPQRTGYTPEKLGANFQVVWTYPFQPEKVYPQVQAIAYAGKIFIGTQMGNMYAINAKTGARVWSFPVGTPILNSVAAANGRIFFGAMDGAIYALDASTGSLAWKSQLSQRLGFSTAPLIIENKIFLGGRNGIFYALSPDSGATLWQFNVDSPILQTAAANNGRVYFGAMNMRAYALNTSNGTLAWQSAQIPGMSFRDYWPIVYQGKVYILPTGRSALGVSDARLVADAAAQQSVLADYAAHPGNYEKTMVVLDEATGQEMPAVIYYPEQSMHVSPAPPCVDRDGYLIIPAPKPSTDYSSGWGRLDVNARLVVDLLNDGTNAGYGNGDETFNVTCTGNTVLTLHTQEGNAHYTGAFNLDTKRWTHIPAGHTNEQMSTNTQGGGGNAASVVEGMIYHISFHELIARSAQP